MHFDERKIKHISNGVEASKIQQIYAHAVDAKKESATVGKLINGEYKTDYSEWCTANFVKFDEIIPLVYELKSDCQILVEKYFNVKCLSSEINFLHYKDGSYYKSHVDGQKIIGNTAERVIDRDITAVTYLNDDYSGGEINFDFFNIKVKPKQGDILIYPTTWQFLHGVEKVIGDRYAIVFWFNTFPQINVNEVIKNMNILNKLKTKI